MSPRGQTIRSKICMRSPATGRDEDGDGDEKSHSPTERTGVGLVLV